MVFVVAVEIIEAVSENWGSWSFDVVVVLLVGDSVVVVVVVVVAVDVDVGVSVGVSVSED